MAFPTRHPYPLASAALALATLAAATAAARGAEVTWPGSGACATTLQACINAAGSGDIIDLAPAGIINESLSVARSLTLRPLAGALTASGEPLSPPVFAAGRYINVDANTGASFAFELDGVVLQRGHVFLGNHNTAATQFRVHGVTVDAVDGNIYGAIAVVNYVAVAPVSAYLDNNRVTLSSNPTTGLPYAGIGIHDTGQSLTASVSWNHVDQLGDSPSATGIYVDVAGSSSVAIVGNRVKGTPHSAVNAGIVVFNGSSTLASGPVQVSNNAVSDENFTATTFAIYLGSNGGALPASVINNTVVRSGEGLEISGASVSGMIANNIFSDVNFVTPASMSNEYNLLWNVATFSGTPGPGTLNADPQLTSALDLRLSPSSPARDTGNNADLPFFSINDADQRARVRNIVVDLGAYEAGDTAYQHKASSANVSSDATFLNNALFDCCNNAHVFVTASTTSDTVDPVVDSGYTGVYYGAGWAVFHENQLLMNPGPIFNIFYPPSLPVDRAFTHTVSATSISGICSVIDNALTNNLPNAILSVTANWNPSGASGVYDNHPLQLAYNGTSHRWLICHADGAAMGFGAGFFTSYNVYVVPPLVTPNAFVAQAGATASASLPLAHPLLDNNPCAAPQIANASAASSPPGSQYAVQFFRHGDSGRWGIVPTPTELGSPTTLPANASFHVFVDGAQANACRDDLIFGSGFYQ